MFYGIRKWFLTVFRHRFYFCMGYVKKNLKAIWTIYQTTICQVERIEYTHTNSLARTQKGSFIRTLVVHAIMREFESTHARRTVG
jgi:hypothetical protein